MHNWSLSALLLLGLAAVAVASSARPANINILFSGGGVRAQFGSMIAACNLWKQLRDIPEAERPFTVRDVVGLSGGSWGSLLLSSRLQVRPDQEMDPCEEVNRVLGMPGQWGRMQEWSTLGCQPVQPGEEACYERWRSGVQAMFVNRDPKSRGSILSPDSSHVAVIHSCDFKDDVPHHWGICAANHTDGQIRCAEFKSRHWFHLPIENTKVGMYDSDHHFNILRERVDLMDLLSLSSVSWADKSIMTMVSNWIWGEPLQPPVIQSEIDLTDPRTPFIHPSSPLETFECEQSATADTDSAAETCIAASKQRPEGEEVATEKKPLRLRADPKPRIHVDTTNERAALHYASAARRFLNQTELQREGVRSIAQGPSTVQTVRLRGCDGGIVCNLPLGYLATLPPSAWEGLDYALVFDFSQQTHADHAMAQCVEFWRQDFGWIVQEPVIQQFGFSLTVKLPPGSFRHSDLKFDPQLVVHVIPFRGITYGDQLVEQFSTVKVIDRMGPLHLEIAQPRAMDHKHANLLFTDYNCWLSRTLNNTNVLSYRTGDDWSQMYPPDNSFLVEPKSLWSRFVDWATGRDPWEGLDCPRSA